MSLDEYRFLWDGTEPGWVLFLTGDTYLPYNEETQMALVIEDDDELWQVTERMRAAGISAVRQLAQE